MSSLTVRPPHPPWQSCPSCTWPRGLWRAQPGGWQSFYSTAATFLLPRCMWICRWHERWTSKVTGLGFTSRPEIAWKTRWNQWNAGDLAAPVDKKRICNDLEPAKVWIWLSKRKDKKFCNLFFKISCVQVIDWSDASLLYICGHVRARLADTQA